MKSTIIVCLICLIVIIACIWKGTLGIDFLCGVLAGGAALLLISYTLGRYAQQEQEAVMEKQRIDLLEQQGLLREETEINT